MVFARRTAALRLTAMAALAASAILISDAMNPDRAFCPLEKACEAAAASPLGSIYGMPTSVLGAAAFGGLFFLTLLPVEWGRRLLQLGGFFAAMAGAGFIIYQALVLKTFCPLCLVADGAGLLAGLITLTWPTPPVRVSGRRLSGEGGTSRLSWTLAGVLAMAIPFAWPRPEVPSWVEIPDQALLEFEDEDVPDEVEAPAAVAAPAPAQANAHPTAIVSTHDWKNPEELAATPSRPNTPPRRPGTPPEAVVAHRPPPQAPSPPRADPAQSTSAQPTSPATPAQPTAPATPAHADSTATPSPTPPEPAAPPPPPQPRRRRGPVIVEYLNAYCGHCRATHHRLEKVLKEMGVEVRRHRVYAWASKGYPLWVRACGYAKDQGAEERLFQELLRAPDQSQQSIFAAARRAGLDAFALQRAVEDPDIPADLVRDCKRMKSAGLKGLPTLDIGRRRLMGDQSEAELRAAIQAALDQARAP